MKKSVLLIALFTIGTFTLSSCRKEYKCTCTRTDSSGGQRIDETTVTSSKKRAQEDCEATVPESDFGKVCVIE